MKGLLAVENECHEMKLFGCKGKVQINSTDENGHSFVFRQ